MHLQSQCNSTRGIGAKTSVRMLCKHMWAEVETRRKLTMRRGCTRGHSQGAMRATSGRISAVVSRSLPKCKRTLRSCARARAWRRRVWAKDVRAMNPRASRSYGGALGAHHRARVLCEFRRMCQGEPRIGRRHIGPFGPSAGVNTGKQPAPAHMRRARKRCRWRSSVCRCKRDIFKQIIPTGGGGAFLWQACNYCNTSHNRRIDAIHT